MGLPKEYSFCFNRHDTMRRNTAFDLMLEGALEIELQCFFFFNYFIGNIITCYSSTLRSTRTKKENGLEMQKKMFYVTVKKS